MKQKELSASQEDYLEMIFFLQNEGGSARPKDIAERMNVRAASVTGALRALSAKEMIHYLPYGAATLTEKGRAVAEKIAVKHTALLSFFTRVLGLKREEAEEFACSMEHSIPDHIMERFKRFVEYTEKCPGFNASWQDETAGYFCRAMGKESQDCENCKLEL